MNSFFKLFGFGCLVLLNSCGDSRNAGTATDTQNTIAGTVVDSMGVPVIGAQVLLVTDPLGFTVPVASLARTSVAYTFADTILSVTSDSKGKFRFDTLPDREFTLSFSHAEKGVQQIVESSPESLQNIDLSVKLERPAALRGTLIHYKEADPLFQFSDHFRLGIAGSGHLIEVVSGRSFVLGGVAPGKQTLVFYPADQYLIAQLVAAGLPLDSLVRTLSLDFASGDTIDLPEIHWSLPSEFYWSDDSLAAKRMLSGKIYGTAACPAEGTRINVVLDTVGFEYPADGSALALADTLTTIADSSGSFRLVAPQGRYFLEFLRKNPLDTTLYCGTANIGPTTSDDFPGNRISDVALKTPAGILGRVSYVEDNALLMDPGDHIKIGIRGTTRYADVLPDQLFSLTGLPEGARRMVFYAGNPFVWQVADTLCSTGRMALVSQSPDVVLSSGSVLQVQGVTYSIPSCFWQ